MNKYERGGKTRERTSFMKIVLIKIHKNVLFFTTEKTHTHTVTQTLSHTNTPSREASQGPKYQKNSWKNKYNYLLVVAVVHETDHRATYILEEIDFCFLLITNYIPNVIIIIIKTTVEKNVWYYVKTKRL